jgi:hypothetical protein
VPRRRVLFSQAEHRYYVYPDAVSCTATIKHTIVGRLHLPWRRTVFRTNVHDTTAPDQLDRLFSEEHTRNAAPPHSYLGGGGCGPGRP